MWADANWKLFFALYAIAYRPRLYGRWLAFCKVNDKLPSKEEIHSQFLRHKHVDNELPPGHVPYTSTALTIAPPSSFPYKRQQRSAHLCPKLHHEPSRLYAWQLAFGRVAKYSSCWPGQQWDDWDLGGR
jgi:hypothetical protein